MTKDKGVEIDFTTIKETTPPGYNHSQAVKRRRNARKARRVMRANTPRAKAARKTGPAYWIKSGGGFDDVVF